MTLRFTVFLSKQLDYKNPDLDFYFDSYSKGFSPFGGGSQQNISAL